MINTILNFLCQSRIEKCKKKCTEDTKYYLERIDALTAALAKSLEVPDIREYLTDIKIVTPHDLISSYDLVYADLEYYTLPFSSWQKILSLVQKSIKARWTTDVFDCDDWALIMNSLVSYSTYKAGLDKQLAFCICWSPSHAYNGFICDNQIWIYEPQNNVLVGTLGYTDKPYDTKKIWLLG